MLRQPIAGLPNFAAMRAQMQGPGSPQGMPFMGGMAPPMLGPQSAMIPPGLPQHAPPSFGGISPSYSPMMPPQMQSRQNPLEQMLLRRLLGALGGAGGISQVPQRMMGPPPPGSFY